MLIALWLQMWLSLRAASFTIMAAARAKAVASGFVIIPEDINQVVRDVGPLLFVSISGDSQSPRLKLRIQIAMKSVISTLSHLPHPACRLPRENFFGDNVPARYSLPAKLLGGQVCSFLRSPISTFFCFDLILPPSDPKCDR